MYTLSSSSTSWSAYGLGLAANGSAVEGREDREVDGGVQFGVAERLILGTAAEPDAVETDAEREEWRQSGAAIHGACACKWCDSQPVSTSAKKEGRTVCSTFCATVGSDSLPIRFSISVFRTCLYLAHSTMADCCVLRCVRRTPGLADRHRQT